MPLENELKVYQFLGGYSEALLKELDPSKAGQLICEGGVSPAWIIGHLGMVSNNVVALLGGTPKIDTEAWKPWFGGGSKPTGDTSDYPAWDELLQVYREGQTAVAEAIKAATDEQMDAPNPSERMRESLPTVREFLGFVLTGHVGMHLGQLSTWRRVQGEPPLF